jgi:redox-sensitive bicupin YhaK (pirin superfamily)
MTRVKSVERVLNGLPTMDGAGVRIYRAIGNTDLKLTDPFLLLDDIHSSNPEDYMAGFPLHPHRGIETVTYMISGVMNHQDSIGNKGRIASGDVQWMTAGSGILHQETPERWDGFMQGFQLWVNLPRKSKMMDPRYRGIMSDEIPTLRPAEGIEIRLVAGRMNDAEGPVRDLVQPIEFLDVALGPGKRFDHMVDASWNCFAYVFHGDGDFGADDAVAVEEGQVAVFGKGDEIEGIAGNKGMRFILAGGKPLQEPVAWGGPVVMNTQDEVDLAFRELRSGTFVKVKPKH